MHKLAGCTVLSLPLDREERVHQTQGYSAQQKHDEAGIDIDLTPAAEKSTEAMAPAGWRRGYAADCKSVKTGSIPVPASKFFQALS